MTAAGNRRSNARFVRCKRWTLAEDSRPCMTEKRYDWNMRHFKVEFAYSPWACIGSFPPTGPKHAWLSLCGNKPEFRLSLNGSMFLVHFEMWFKAPLSKQWRKNPSHLFLAPFEEQSCDGKDVRSWRKDEEQGREGIWSYSSHKTTLFQWIKNKLQFRSIVEIQILPSRRLIEGQLQSSVRCSKTFLTSTKKPCLFSRKSKSK